MSRTLDETCAYPAASIAAAEAPLTAGTEEYMHAAAAVLAEHAATLLGAEPDEPRGRVLVLAGGGRNGCDALLAGALLASGGRPVTALLATEHPHEGALRVAREAGVEVLPGSARAVGAALRGCGEAAALGSGEAVSTPASAHTSTGQDHAPGLLVIDGLTGLGASGPLRPAVAALIAPLLAAGARGERPFHVLAVDLPSGTGVDDGTLPGPVLPADLTVTFTCLRGAHLLPPAAPLCGRVVVADLGLPVPQVPALAQRPADAGLIRRLRVPGDTDHKYTRGVVGLWAGSETYPGAAVLATSAAVRTGAGMVRLAAPWRVEDLVLARRPEVVPARGRCQAIVVGPGTDPADGPRAAELRSALEEAAGVGVPAVVDAGALPLLPELLDGTARLPRDAILTPHAGEAAALLGALDRPCSREEVEAAPAAAARELAGLTGFTVLLKGTPTLIAGPDGGPLLSLDPGPGWLATAGSGDVLAGILGTVLAAVRADAEAEGAAGDMGLARAAALAVRVHATAAALASGAIDSAPGRPIAALDVAEAVPWAIEALRG